MELNTTKIELIEDGVDFIINTITANGETKQVPLHQAIGMCETALVILRQQVLDITYKKAGVNNAELHGI